jgi:tRNA A37 threonylcarbamoyladenosine biosynthesis protein TsaE
MFLGNLIAQRYLNPEDRLIGLVGDAGAGKSLLIRGMFPGLILTNDDDGINVRPAPLLADFEADHFRTHTYHLDVRFEAAFRSWGEMAQAVQAALRTRRRVVIEHFEQLFPALQSNAEVLIGIGEEVVVYRPGVFGPDPRRVADQVFASLKYRKAAHSAEDLTALAFARLGYAEPEIHSDVRRGFLLEFPHPPRGLDLEAVERMVNEYIAADAPICYVDDEHIKVGDVLHTCSGPRLHVRSAGEIGRFRLMKDFLYDSITRLYLLAGLVGEAAEHPPQPVGLCPEEVSNETP